MAVQAIRAEGMQGTKVGPAENINVLVPLVETAKHIAAAQAATREANAPYMTVVLEDRYTDTYLQKAGKDAPKVTADDLKVISSPLDFVGINVYRPMNYALASDEAPGWREISFSKSHPKMTAKWHTLDPVALYWAPKFVQSLWGAKEIHITENGCATDDEPAADGKFYDTDRIMFLRAYLTQLQRATAEGVPVKGYFQWSIDGQFRVERGPQRESLRAGVRRLQDAEAHTEDERVVLPGNRETQCGGVITDTPTERRELCRNCVRWLRTIDEYGRLRSHIKNHQGRKSLIDYAKKCFGVAQ